MRYIVFLLLLVTISSAEAQWVAVNTSTTTPQVYITSGKVGIGYSGTPSPALTAQLQLYTSTDNRQIVLNSGISNKYQIAGFGYNSSQLKYFVPSTSSSHIFFDATSSSLTELMRISGGGLVGIGTTTTPLAKLQVVGRGIVSGSLSVGKNAVSPQTINFQVTGKTLLSDYVGINTGSAVGSTLVTMFGGDLRIIETSDYSKMPDGKGADLILVDKVGGILDISQNNNISAIDIAGTSTSLRMGTNWDMQRCLHLFKDGKVAIGATPTGHLSRPSGYRLFVKDGILTEKLKLAGCADAVNWADYVFSEGYNLKPLDKVDTFIRKNHHLEEVPSAKEVHKNGIDVIQMDVALLKKVEELTLYIINQEEQIEELEKKIEARASKKK